MRILQILFPWRMQSAGCKNFFGPLDGLRECHIHGRRTHSTVTKLNDTKIMFGQSTSTLVDPLAIIIKKVLGTPPKYPLGKFK